MKSYRKVIIKVIAVCAAVTLLVGGVAGVRYVIYEQNRRADAAKQKEREDFVKRNQDISYAGKSVNGVELFGKTAEEIVAVMDEQKKGYLERTVSLQINQDNYRYTMKQLNESIVYVCSDGSKYSEEQESELAKKIVQLDKNESMEKQYQILKKTADGTDFSVTLQCSANKKKIAAIMAKFRKKYIVPVKNSYMDANRKISKSKKGQSLDIKKMEKELKAYLNSEQKSDYTANYTTTVVKPKWTEKELKKLKCEIGSFSTNYVGATSRGHNIQVGVSRINGTCLLPGESISFAEKVHDNTDGRYLKKAGSYLNGKVVQTEGGGICQISTTAYNAFLQAGIIPQKRYPHSMPVHYVPLGLDAAISTGVKDLEIKNTLDVPILILGETTNRTVSFRILSFPGAKKGYTYKTRSVQLSALRAKAYLDVYKGKKKIKSILLHTDVYS